MNGIASWFANRRVRDKILIGYAMVLVLMLLIALLVSLQATAIEELNREAERTEAVQNEGQEIALALADRTAAFRDYLISGQDVALTTYREADGRFQAALTRARELVVEPGQLARLDTIVLFSQDWEVTVAQVGISLRQQQLGPGVPPADTVILFMQGGEGRRGAFRARELVSRFQDRAAELATVQRDELRESVQRIRYAVIIFTLVAGLVALLFGTYVARTISVPLARAVEFASGVAAGDLTRRLPIDTRDEIGELGGTLNRMAEDLRSMVGVLNSTTAQVASAAEQIAATSGQISETTDEQAKSTEELSSAMEQVAAQITRVARSTESLAVSVDQTSSSIGEMSASIEQTAGSADALGGSVEQTSTTIEEMVTSITQVGRHVRETRAIAHDAEQDARAGGEAVSRTTEGMRRIHGEMSELVETMRELGATSEAVGRISEVIEDIADQTNLLALNAAIEAARAGEHGRGFAVVAQEVRRLAERSVESTREIGNTVRGVRKELQRAVQSTGAVAERTQEGIHLAEEAADALTKIIDSASRTLELMEEVSLATEQQIGAAEQAQEAILHIRQVAEETRTATREQAHGSRQIVQAVENMNQQTQEVFAATGEQKRGGEMILQSTESISRGARDSQSATRELARAAQELSVQANRLAEMVGEFRV